MKKRRTYDFRLPCLLLALVTAAGRANGQNRNGSIGRSSFWNRASPFITPVRIPGRPARSNRACKDAQTFADYISYDMEHAPFDVRAWRITCAGWRRAVRPRAATERRAVIVNVPVTGVDEASVRANAWMFAQVLATGVHGYCCAMRTRPPRYGRSLKPVRFPLHKQGVDQGNQRRDGVASTACPPRRKSGVFPPDEYLDKADPGRSIRKANFCSESSWRISTPWPTRTRF